MHTKAVTTLTCLLALGLGSSLGWAQEEPVPAPQAPEGSAEPGAVAQAEPVPMAEPEPAPAADPMAESTPEPLPPAAPPEAMAEGEIAPMAEPAEAESSDPAGWFRLDSDGLGLQLWVGATHDVGFDLATDIYVTSDTFAEFDIGPALTLGEGVALTPMVGIGFDWAAKQAVSLIAPQLFTILDFDPVYFESWIQGFFNSPFTEGANNDLYFRNFLLFSVLEDWAIGPHVEFTLALNNKLSDDEAAAAREAALDADPDADVSGIVSRKTFNSLQVGGATSLNYGTDNTLLLFLGMETQDQSKGADEEALVGRFTFVRTW